jgi:plasmid stability protein
MTAVATLYVRNLPAGLYDELRRWAEERGRSVNAEVIDLLARVAARRREDKASARSLAAYFEKYGDKPVESNVVELIHEGREREWLDEYLSDRP